MIDFFRSQIYELALCDFVKFCIIVLNCGAEKVSSPTHNNNVWWGGGGRRYYQLYDGVRRLENN